MEHSGEHMQFMIHVLLIFMYTYIYTYYIYIYICMHICVCVCIYTYMRHGRLPPKDPMIKGKHKKVWGEGSRGSHRLPSHRLPCPPAFTLYLNSPSSTTIYTLSFIDYIHDATHLLTLPTLLTLLALLALLIILHIPLTAPRISH
jgi:hypothetical protein